MFSYSGGSVCLEVPHLTGLVTGGCEHLRTILWYRSFIEEGRMAYSYAQIL